MQQIEDVACDALLRLAKNRVLYRAAPAPTGKRGAPKKDGNRFQPQEAASHGEPDAAWSGTDRKGQPITVTVWHGLHFKDARTTRVSVYRVERPQAQESKRDPRTSWFVFCGHTAPSLSEVSDVYALRFSQEHGYRVDKQSLLWETPRLRTPEQFQCWTDMVACVRNQLFLARSLSQIQRQPWEREARERTPPQVRRAMRGIIAQLGTPTRLPQLRGNRRDAVPEPLLKRLRATKRSTKQPERLLRLSKRQIRGYAVFIVQEVGQSCKRNAFHSWKIVLSW